MPPPWCLTFSVCLRSPEPGPCRRPGHAQRLGGADGHEGVAGGRGAVGGAEEGELLPQAGGGFGGFLSTVVPRSSVTLCVAPVNCKLTFRVQFFL